MEDFAKGVLVGIVGCAVYDLIKAVALRFIARGRAEGTGQGKHFR